MTADWANTLNGTHIASKISRWWVFIPAAVLALFNATANATDNTGLHAVYYQINEIPPVKSVDTYNVCGSEIENNINRNFEGEPFEQCPNDMFMVRYTGYITVPAHEAVQFWLAADDGGTMDIGGYQWGTWDDKGCTAIETEPVTMESNTPIPLEGWFYENGGGTCFMLAWNIDNRGWEIVPDEAFTVSAPPATTTTVEQTTTTAEQTTTTTVQPSTTVVYSSSTTIETTTSTTNAPSTTQPISTTSPTTSTVVGTTTTVVTTLPPDTTTTQPLSPTTTQPLDTVLAQPINQDIAVALATDSATLETATQQQAEQIFDAIDIGTLSDGEVAAIVDAVQDAPTTVREAFEQEIDIYSGKTDNYIPLGSSVNVATRRMLVVSVAFTIAMPIAPSRRSL